MTGTGRLQEEGELGRSRFPLHIFSGEIPAWLGGDGRGTSIWLSAVSEATLKKKKTIWRVGIGYLWKLLRGEAQDKVLLFG